MALELTKRSKQLWRTSLRNDCSMAFMDLQRTMDWRSAATQAETVDDILSLLVKEKVISATKVKSVIEKARKRRRESVVGALDQFDTFVTLLLRDCDISRMIQVGLEQFVERETRRKGKTKGRQTKAEREWEKAKIEAAERARKKAVTQRAKEEIKREKNIARIARYEVAKEY